MAPMNNRLMRPRATGLTDPRTITGLELWLDFNDSSTLTLSGTSISEASDKSGKGWKAVQATGANQPTLVTNAINGRSVASFNGSSQSLTVASFPALTDTTAFAVCYRNWATNSYQCVASTASYTGGGTTGHALFLSIGATQLDWIAGDLACFGNGFSTGRAPRTIGENSGLSNSQAVVLSATLNTVSSGMWRNGTSIATRVNSAGTGNSASGTFRVGAAPTSDFWGGVIAEFLLYTSALSGAQIKSVERYLGTRYGITVA